MNSSDLKARLNLDQDGKDGRLRVRNAAGENAVELDARSANVINLFSNRPDESNGLVKAWAQINLDGTIEACWRCNTDTDETRRLDEGLYEVDFTPLAPDVRGRPRLATFDFHTVSPDGLVPGAIVLQDRDDDASSVLVETGGADMSFVLMIY